MAIDLSAPYEIVNEYNLAEMLDHFDSDYIVYIINNKLDNFDFSSVLKEPNVVISFEDTFKAWYSRFPGDQSNIKAIRPQVYADIIHVLCDRYNLSFNDDDDTIDLFTAAYYLYDFLVCNRVNNIVNFFVSFIINNKDSLCQILEMDEYKKSKESESIYSKQMFDDPKYGIISANIVPVMQHISGLDITLFNIFQSLYANPSVVEFLDNAVADKGNFFNDYYASVLNRPEDLPIIIVNIKLQLQHIVGNNKIQEINDMILYSNNNQSTNQIDKNFAS